MEPIARVLSTLNQPPKTSKTQGVSKPEWACDICHDVGHYRIDVSPYDERFGKLIRCECRQVSDCVKSQLIFGTYLEPDLLLEKFDARGPASRQAKELAVKFIPYPHGFITLWGSNGNGKSTYLKAITNECIGSAIGSLYITAYDLMEYIKAGFGKDFGADDRILQVANFKVLCIDELTQVRWTDYVAEAMQTILDRRYQMRETKGTVIAMDENPADTLHPRLVSRLKSGTVINITESDLRPAMKTLF